MSQTQRGDSHVKLEADVGIVSPQAQECPRLPGAGRGKAGSSPRGCGGRWVVILDFKPPELGDNVFPVL